MACQEMQYTEDVIKGKKWAENMYAELEQQMKYVFFNWVALVTELSTDPQEIDNWSNDFKCAVEDTLTNLLEDIQHLHKKLLTKVEEALKYMETLSKTLAISMPSVGEENLALCQEYRKLQEQTQQLEKMLEQRKEEANSLNENYLHLCTSLGQKPLLFNIALPSSKELQLLKNQIQALEEEKTKRLKERSELREKILEIVTELHYEPSTSFEKEILSNAEGSITDENMMELRRFSKRLESERCSIREEIASIWSKLHDLWNKLNIDLLRQQNFKEVNKGYSLITLKNLRHEVVLCEELKKVNIEKFVAELRSELADLWKMCHCDPKEGEANFQFFNTDHYSDTVLEIFEEEIKKWKSYYEENKDLLQLLNQHKKLWTKMIELFAQSTDTRRLRNRGGQLLKEEKARNKLKKEIPIVEDRIRNLAVKFEHTHKKPFMTFGSTVDEYLQKLQEQWEDVKKQQSSAKKTPASTVPLTPLRQASRVLGTPKCKPLGLLTSSCKKAKPTQKMDSKKENVKITVSTMKSTKRRSLEMKENIEKKKLKRLKLLEEGPDDKYEDFKDVLDKSPGLRSTDNHFASVKSANKNQEPRTVPLTSRRSPQCSPSKLFKSDFRLIF